jgi:hypothetical protein
MKNRRSIGFAVGVGAVALFAGAATALPPATGTYQLHDHPDGTEVPPAYGLRLDELFNATADHDVFTFDFDNALSNMRMDYTGTTIHIYGVAFGGRDIGNAYANDAYRGVYTINFTYNFGVGIVPGDDDVYVNPGTHYNFGTITSPGGTTVNLRDGHYDASAGQLDFRFGNEDNDLGHRGFNGLSGWGWLFHQVGGPTGTYVNDTSDDWLFTATLIPAPGTAALLGLGGLIAGRRNRR